MPSSTLLLMVLSACAPEPTHAAQGAQDTATAVDSAVTGDSGHPPAAGRVLVAEPVEACASPVPVERVDVTRAMGLDAERPPTRQGPDGTGMLAADLDGDGDTDLVQSYEGWDRMRVWWREGEAFIPVDVEGTEALHLIGTDAGSPFLAAGATLAWMDPTLERGEVLFDASPGFVRDAAQVEGIGVFVALASSTDRDADRMDRLVGGPALGPVAGHEAFDLLQLDVDGDGTRELLVINDNKGDPSRRHALWRVEAGALVEEAEARGLGWSMEGMGADAGDINEDGFLDVFITGAGRNLLLLNDGEGRFYDATEAWAANPMTAATEMGWGGVFLDDDNDGDLDLVLAQGDFGGNPPFAHGPQPVTLMRNTGGRLDDRTVLETGRWRTILPLELNGDGVLDLVLVGHDGMLRAHASTGCSPGSWLAVDAPDGSLVRVTAGSRTWTAPASLDAGYGGARPARAWIGLGTTTVVDRLTVDLPGDGGRLVLEGPLEARRRVRVTSELDPREGR